MKFRYFYIAIFFLLEIGAILPSLGAPSNSQLQKKPANIAKTAITNTSQISGSKKVMASTPVKNAAPTKNVGTTKNAASTQNVPSLKNASSPTNNQAVSQSKTVVLQGQIKRHKHPFKSLLKEEFDSPIHPITTDNKDF